MVHRLASRRMSLGRLRALLPTRDATCDNRQHTTGDGSMTRSARLCRSLGRRQAWARTRASPRRTTFIRGLSCRRGRRRLALSIARCSGDVRAGWHAGVCGASGRATGRHEGRGARADRRGVCRVPHRCATPPSLPLQSSRVQGCFCMCLFRAGTEWDRVRACSGRRA